jgi:hypothetical protein
LKEELALLLKNAGECIKAGYQIMRQGTNNTSKHGFTYKSVPKNEVVCRSGDYTGITYVVKEVRYVFGHEYHDRCEIKEVDPILELMDGLDVQEVLIAVIPIMVFIR